MAYFRLSCNRLRHLVATIICAVSPEDAPKLAKFMCHSVEQQQNTYKDLLTTSDSVRMSTIVSKILSNDKLEPTDFDDAELGKS